MHTVHRKEHIPNGSLVCAGQAFSKTSIVVHWTTTGKSNTVCDISQPLLILPPRMKRRLTKWPLTISSVVKWSTTWLFLKATCLFATFFHPLDIFQSGIDWTVLLRFEPIINPIYHMALWNTAVLWIGLPNAWRTDLVN